MPKDLKIRYVGEGEFTDPKLLAQIDKLEREAEEDIQAMNVNFRWTREKVDVVKHAAEAMGLPYQAYIKHVVYRQAIQDLRAVNEALNPSRPKGD